MSSENEKKDSRTVTRHIIYVILRLIDSGHGPILMLLAFGLGMHAVTLYMLPNAERLTWMKHLSDDRFYFGLGWGLAIIQAPLYYYFRNISRRADAAEIKRLNEANQKFVQMDLNFKLDPPKKA